MSPGRAGATVTSPPSWPASNVLMKKLSPPEGVGIAAADVVGEAVAEVAVADAPDGAVDLRRQPLEGQAGSGARCRPRAGGLRCGEEALTTGPPAH